MTRHITVQTVEGRKEHATTWDEARLHWLMLEANGYEPVEYTGDV